MGQKERVLSLEHEGNVYNLTAKDFNALDELAIWKATGTTLLQVFTGGATMFTIAALVWRFRVNEGEDDLTYETVARSFNYEAMKTVTDEPRESGHPEA